MFGSRPIALVLLLTSLVPALLPGLAGRPIVGAVAARAQPVPTCVPGTDLVVNGSFERPQIAADSVALVALDGWTGSHAIENGNSRFVGEPRTGAQYISDIDDSGLTQTLDTTGLDGATITLVFFIRTYPGPDTIAQLGPNTRVVGGTESLDSYGQVSLDLMLADPAPATTLVSISGGVPDLDDVSVTVTDCGTPPVASPSASPSTSASPSASMSPVASASPVTPRPSDVRPPRSPRPGSVVTPAPTPESPRPARSPRPTR